jgi:hypothetical protein
MFKLSVIVNRRVCRRFAAALWLGHLFSGIWLEIHAIRAIASRALLDIRKRREWVLLAFHPLL